MKYCRDCKHLARDLFDMGKYPNAFARCTKVCSPVGRPTFADDARRTYGENFCGVEAKFFEPMEKDVWYKKLLSRFC